LNPIFDKKFNIFYCAVDVGSSKAINLSFEDGRPFLILLTG
jgi:hypothetical protein